MDTAVLYIVLLKTDTSLRLINPDTLNILMMVSVTTDYVYNSASIILSAYIPSTPNNIYRVVFWIHILLYGYPDNRHCYLGYITALEITDPGALDTCIHIPGVIKWLLSMSVPRIY